MNSTPNVAPAPKTQTLNLDANVAALLCYIPFFPVNVGSSILWLATEPRTSRFVRFHAAQGLALFVAFFALFLGAGIGGMIVAMVLSIALGELGLIVSMLVNLVMLVAGLGGFVLLVLGMIKAYQGEEWEMPVIGPIARRFA